MDKRYQVFVSSTYEDLQEERKEVMQALLELDCIPAGMELFPASNDDQWTLIKKVIDDCDYYILIIGGRYGSTNEDGKSYTQMEFEYALSTGKPIISFLPKHPQNIPSGKTEQDADKRERLEKFKELAKSKLIKYWENPDNLGSVVSRSMIRLIKDCPAEGWIRASSAVDEKSVKEVSRLQKENAQLKEELLNFNTKAPAGTTNLAQGEDEVLLRFDFDANDGSFQVDSFSSSFPFTWNEIFSCVAPHMIEECSERVFINCIEDYIEKDSQRILKSKKLKQYEALYNFRIHNESFNTVKVQLRALGLIILSEKKRTPSDKSTYWKLTPYGDYVMTQLLAIKKYDNN